ncbi:MAG: ATP-dependent zinc metalloprotease FtsH [Oscillospiraceae bacterium]|jgi:cell division protease FtsH|nr:ATP-dependent zinc metalloprotease FtsH [Oscillospiraceae bacterium]
MNPNQDNNNKNGKPQGGLNIFHFLIAGFIITFILNMVFSSMSSNRKVQIEYSQFIALVESGSVKQVQLEPEQILITLNTDADRESTDEILNITTPDVDDEKLKERMERWNEQIRQNNVYYTGRVDDPGLTQRLIDNNVAFYQPIVQSNPILDFIMSWILPIAILYIIYFFFIRSMSKRMGGEGGMGGIGGMMGVGKSNAKVYNVEKNTGVTFADVAGQDEAKESLDEMVDFLHNPEKYQKIGAKQPKGALLVGPPGTGKTLLAKAVAGEAGVPFFSLSGSEFVEMFVGVGASRVRDLFQQASKKAPCIVFIDEIDAIGKSRDNQIGGNDEREQTLNQLLAEMDGFDSSKGIVVLAATNRPEVLDKALLRPGRFDRRVIVEKPDLPGREAILGVHAAKVTLAPDVNLREIALATSGATGADLANMVNEAALRAVRMDRFSVTQEDLMEAVELVIAGKEKKDRILNPREKRMVAYHEVGHALTTALQKDGQPVQKITIVPRTMGSLGYTMNMPEEERYLMTKAELLAQITTLLAGRAAEEIEFGESSTGASNDIERATKMARSMVTQYGMSDKFDMMSLESTQNQYLDGRNVATCSEATGALIDDEVRAIIKACHEKARGLLEENKEKMSEIAEFLIEKETITGAQFMDILNDSDKLPA